MGLTKAVELGVIVVSVVGVGVLVGVGLAVGMVVGAVVGVGLVCWGVGVGFRVG